MISRTNCKICSGNFMVGDWAHLFRNGWAHLRCLPIKRGE
jgi:hypothetical protein